ncbi:hypothetical protein HPB47_007498 [Ixodes persulcatus]|uniref:Uncharacterized protein n=1 Tax=Ixodes persulcatus TaxID=34615 RepID=A0AC60P7B6_IXOPE|nr:hypothetical protein HPB47_007498 [Ixodes persulcatus]
MSTATKAQCFSFNVPEETPVNAIMDSNQAVAGGDGLSYLQHHGGARFMAAVITMAATQRLVAQWEPTLCFSVYHLPPHVSEEALVQVLAHYGKMKAINHATFRDHPDVRTGTRVVKMEMSKPVPNFVHLQGHRMMVHYRGLRSVASSDLHARPHVATDTAFLGMQRQVARPLANGARVVAPVAFPAPEHSSDDSSSSIRPRAPSPPPVVSDSDASSNAGVSDSQALGVLTNADAIPGKEASRRPSDDFDRLFIAEEGDVTPGQGYLPSTPEASTNTTPREASAESASPEDADMPDDRSDVKRVFSPAGGGSDAAPASSVEKKRLGPDHFDNAESLEF